MTEEADLIVHRKPISGECYVDSFEWRGPASAPVRITITALNELLPHRDARFPPYIEVGPYPLRLIPETPWELFAQNAALYARVDSLNRLSWLRHAADRIARRFLMSFYYRVIFTLEVWGLARVKEGCRPSWRDIGRR